jgi:hypothetical protein
MGRPWRWVVEHCDGEHQIVTYDTGVAVIRTGEIPDLESITFYSEEEIEDFCEKAKELLAAHHEELHNGEG